MSEANATKTKTPAVAGQLERLVRPHSYGLSLRMTLAYLPTTVAAPNTGAVAAASKASAAKLTALA